MCGGRFSRVTHPYTYKPYTLYRCVWGGGLSIHTYTCRPIIIVNVLSYTIVKGCVVADSRGEHTLIHINHITLYRCVCGGGGSSCNIKYNS